MASSVQKLEVGASGGRCSRHLAALCLERGIGKGFVITNEDNETAIQFYGAVGDIIDDVVWGFVIDGETKTFAQA